MVVMMVVVVEIVMVVFIVILHLFSFHMSSFLLHRIPIPFSLGYIGSQRTTECGGIYGSGMKQLQSFF